MLEVTYRPFKGADENSQLYEYYPTRTEVMDFGAYADLLLSGNGHILHAKWLNQTETAEPAKDDEDVLAAKWNETITAMLDSISQLPNVKLQDYFDMHKVSVQQLKHAKTVRLNVRKFLYLLGELGFIRQSEQSGTMQTF